MTLIIRQHATACLLALTVAILFSLSTQWCVNAQDVRSNVTQLIQYWGYPVEQHDVTTPDGYILSV